MNKMNLSATISLTSFLVAGTFVAAATPQEKNLAEIYRTGKVRFVPVVTITDESMARKAFFSSLMDIALDEQGNLYACDIKESNIKKFDATGSFLGTIGRPGQGPGEFKGPWEVEWSKGGLYVREMGNMRISILDGNDNFAKSVRVDMSGGIWWKMQALPDGRFLVEKEKVNREDLNAPQEMFIDLYSADLEFIKTIYQHEVRRDKYITEPLNINVPQPFAALVFWQVSPAGKVIIGYSGKYEFEIHDPDKGKTSSFFHPYKPVEVTAKDKEFHFKSMVTTERRTGDVGTQKRGAPNWIVRNTEFPRYKPAYNNIKVDAEGNIWVQPYDLIADKAEPRMDVFDSAGRFLSSVMIVDGTFPNTMAPLPDGFWAAKKNEDGLWTIVKYRISK